MRIYRKFVQKLPIRLFLLLKNLQSTIQRESTRYCLQAGLILIKNPNRNWMTHRERLHLYVYGLANRGESIGKSYLLREIEFRNGDAIIDCGANMGDLQLYFMNRSIDIQYIGIEPNPIDFNCLEKNLILDHKALNIALWSETNTLEFFVDSKLASSSLIEPPTYTEVIKIKACRLDELELPLKIKLLKVEGEGAEPEIVMGCANFLHRIEYISADVGPERGRNQESTRNEVVEYLTKNNFEIILENPYYRKTILFKNKIGFSC